MIPSKDHGSTSRVIQRRPPATTQRILAVVLFCILAFAYLHTGRSCPQQAEHALDTSSWAQYSPYRAAAVYEVPPRECKVIQVNTIQRHGARYPTRGAGAKIEAAVDKLQLHRDAYRDRRLEFLKEWDYPLGENDMVPLGYSQSFESGEDAYRRYRGDLGDAALPFVRASDSERVIASAVNWTQGKLNSEDSRYAAASHSRSEPIVSVIVSEIGNNTLNNDMCPNAGNAAPQTNAWLSIWAALARTRLNDAAPGSNLSLEDVSSLVSLCAFHSVALASKRVMTHEETSPFCALFTNEEFEGYGYSGDLNKYYNTGYGQDLGRVQGVGYVNELLARLTGQPVKDSTQTNRTLDSNPQTFPLDRKFYIDFSHDNQMVGIFAAMGLFAQSKALDPEKPDAKRTWIVSRMVPFSSRMVVEKLDCAGEQFVRTIVNDAVQPMEFCGGETHDGLCKLSAFVESQSYSRNNGEGDFERCFG